MRAGLIIRWIIGQMRNRGAHNEDDYYLARWRNKGRDSMNMLSKLAIRLTAQKLVRTNSETAIIRPESLSVVTARQDM